jgi:hypothetical protein
MNAILMDIRRLPYDVFYVVFKFLDMKTILSFIGVLNRVMDKHICDILDKDKFEFILRNYPRRFGLDNDGLRMVEKYGLFSDKVIKTVLGAMVLKRQYTYLRESDLEKRMFKYLVDKLSTDIGEEDEKYIETKSKLWSHIFGLANILSKGKCPTSHKMMKRKSNITFISRHDRTMDEVIKYNRNKPKIVDEIVAYRRMKKMMSTYCITWCMTNEYGDIIYQNVSVDFHDNAKLEVQKLFVFSPPCIFIMKDHRFISKEKIISHEIGCHTGDLTMRLNEINDNDIKITTFGKDDTKDKRFLMRIIENRWMNKLINRNEKFSAAHKTAIYRVHSTYDLFVNWSDDKKFNVYEKNYAFWYAMEKQIYKIGYPVKNDEMIRTTMSLVRCGRTYISKYMKTKFPYLAHRDKPRRKAIKLGRLFMKSEIMNRSQVKSVNGQKQSSNKID